MCVWKSDLSLSYPISYTKRKKHLNIIRVVIVIGDDVKGKKHEESLIYTQKRWSISFQYQQSINGVFPTYFVSVHAFTTNNGSIFRWKYSYTLGLGLNKYLPFSSLNP